MPNEKLPSQGKFKAFSRLALMLLILIVVIFVGYNLFYVVKPQASERHELSPSADMSQPTRGYPGQARA